MRRRTRVIVLGVVMLVGAAANGQAGPITVDAGQTVLFNFDLPGTDPYTTVDLLTGLDFSTLNVSDQGQWRAYSDLNGTGTKTDLGSVFLPGAFLTYLPGMLDGVFSTTLTMTSGSITVDPSAIAFSLARGGVVTASPTSVPEPGSLALLGVGLAGMGVRRWRQRRAR